MKKHKKRGILCAIGAVLFAVAIPQMDASKPAEIAVAVLITLVLTFVAVRSLFPNFRLSKRRKTSSAPVTRRHGNPQQRSASAVSRPPVPAQKQPEAPKYKHYEFHVTGVTFQSDDGTPRQEYLRRIDNGAAPFENSGSLDVSLCPYMYKPKRKPEEQAIAVRVNGYDVGNVPRESIPAVMNAMRKPGAVISALKVIGGDAGKNYGAIVVVRHNL